MKSSLSLFLFFSLILSSCSSSLRYLGDKYTPRQEVEVFYDAKDIKKDYKTIGKIILGESLLVDSKDIKRMILKKCTEVGADAVILDLRRSESVTDGESTQNSYVTAKLLRYYPL